MAGQVYGVPQLHKVRHGQIAQIDAPGGKGAYFIELEAQSIGFAVGQQPHIADIKQRLKQHIGAGFRQAEIAHDGGKGRFVARQIIQYLCDTADKRITVAFGFCHPGIPAEDGEIPRRAEQAAGAECGGEGGLLIIGTVVYCQSAQPADRPEQGDGRHGQNIETVFQFTGDIA